MIFNKILRKDFLKFNLKKLNTNSDLSHIREEARKEIR